MKGIFTSLLLLFLVFHTASAQPNMVPNGSFEFYSTCPTHYGQVANATGWGFYQNTPDYFNSCYSSSTIKVGVPTNIWGSENAAHGNAYVGGVFYNGSESFTRQITPLTSGRSYEVSLSVSLADNSKYAVDAIGVYFFDNGRTSVSSTPVLTPQVDFSSYGPFTNKSGWIRLIGYFVTDSAYDNIVIGNFKASNLVNVVTLSSGSINNAFYYFDSIVVRQENLALQYTDSMLCAGDSLVLPYFANSDSFNTGNVFTLQLSNASGSFASGTTTTLATVSGRNSGVFRTVIPTTITAGSGYRLRVVSSNFPFVSRDNGKNISIGNIRPNKPVATSNSPVCTADTLRLSATTTTTGSFNWHWKGPNNFTSTHQNPKIGAPTGAAVGNYYVTVSSYGCIAKDTTLVIVNTSPAAITASSNSAICEQDTLKLFSTFSSPGVTYSWAGPDSFSSSGRNTIIANAPTTAGGKYYVTATAANGCYRKDSVTVNVKPKPFVSASGNGPVCVANGISLSANNTVAGATFLWNGPGSFVSTNQNPTISSASTSNAGSYIVTATLNGCIDTGVTIIIVNTLPSLSVSSNSPVCLLDTIKLLSTAPSGVSYNWTGPSSLSATTANPFIANASIVNEGYYKLTITDTNGCTRTDSVNITTKPLPVCYPSNTSPVCAGTSFSLGITSSYTGASYQWTGPNGFTSTSTSPTISSPPANASGVYILTASMNGCTYSATTNATVHPIPVAKPTTQLPVCVGSTVQLIGNSFPGATYRWNGPSFSSTLQSPSFAATGISQNGNYVLVMTANGCVSKPDTVCIKINTLPKLGGYVSPNDTICQGATATFVSFVQNGGPEPTAQWYKNHVPVGNINVQQYTPSTINNGDVYYCKLTAPGVCYTTLTLYTDTIRMTVLPVVAKPELEITASPGLHVQASDIVKFTAQVKHGGPNPKYQWYKNGLKQTGATVACWSTTGLAYMDMIHVEVVGDDPCAQNKNASDTVWIQFPASVKEVDKPNLMLYPNPNNGSFNIRGIPDADVDVEIVNALGQVIYRKKEMAENGSVQIRSGLVPGSYMLKVHIDEKTEVLRFSVY